MQEILVQYKKDFVTEQWPEERYKWEAVKHFQDHWDPDAADFPAMLEESLAKTGNLLTSGQYFPRKMIEVFATDEPERVRGMFAVIFDENRDLFERVSTFRRSSEKLRKENGAVKDHQDVRAISTYLWLRFPNRHYIYRWSEARRISKALDAGYRFKKGDHETNLRDHLEMYDSICEALQADNELTDLMNSQLTTECYPDPELKTLTIDVGFYISGIDEDSSAKGDGWWPSSDEYHPGLTVEEWEDLLDDQKVFDHRSLEIMKRLKDIGGQATCQALADKYGNTKNFYNGGSSSLAERVANRTGCEVPASRPNSKWWPILYTGRKATKDETGSYVYRLRDELSEALDNVDLSSVPLYANEELVPEAQSIASHESAAERYAKDDFLNEVFMSSDTYDRLTGVLRNKKNIILQGAPGVGKTFAAQRLAWSMMGEKDKDRVQFVQFHQNYSYEDFVMGYKPSGEGFELKNGIFYSFCQKAANYPEQDFFFLIDEINRGNLSKIFGELLMLIEKDYRGTPATLAYNGLPFSVPENVHIIGMMNTADRSLAMIDYALRRRFSFFEIEPGFETDGFTHYREGLSNDSLNALIASVQLLNAEIRADKSLGKGFCIGHSYFCGRENSDVSTDEWLHNIVEYDILPMLAEYWFDEEDKVETWRTRLTGAITQ